MAGYNYGPPPPAPQPAQSGHPAYSSHGASFQHSGSRGGGAGSHVRGRGGHFTGGRADYQSSPPQYEYGAGGQAYPSHHGAQYAGASQAGAAPYTQHQQWQPEYGHAPQHGAHAPVPLSSSNYHPNYAPQMYAQGQHPHHPSYAPPPPPPQQQGQYPPQHPSAAPAPYSSHQPWTAPNSHPQPPYGGGRSRGGGYGNDRGGHRASNAGSGGRQGFEQDGMQPQVSGSYGPPYQDPRAPLHYQPPPQYPPYHAQPPSAHVPPPGSYDPYYSQDGHGGRGRGGGFRGGNHRGRPAHSGPDRMRHRKPHHGHEGGGGGGNNNNNNNNNHNNQKHDQGLSGKKKKRKTNTLGLTPGQESDVEDDEQEEERLQKLIGQDTLQIADLAAYIAERRKNFPTAARVKAKKSAELAQSNGSKLASALEEQERMANKLRRQLQKVESSIKRKREQQDEGDEMRDSSPPSDIKSDDDAEPEALSSRPPQAAAAHPPSAKKADVSKHCKYYSTGGTCGKKGKCRFVHDSAVREAAMREREANNGQLTIQQRLILNDKEQEDLTILQSIQYLRDKGVVQAAKGEANGNKNGNDTPSASSVTTSNSPQQTRAASSTSSSLPAAPRSLPPVPVKRSSGLPPHNPPPSSLAKAGNSPPQTYKGWNLSGYGNSGLKSDDLP